MSENIHVDKTQTLKQIVRQIFLQTILRIDPQNLITEDIKRDGDYLIICGEQIDLKQFNRIVVIGFGKASLKMALGLQTLLSDRSIEGIVATNGLFPAASIAGLEVIVGGHPYPDAGSCYAASRAIELVSGADQRTLIFNLISGGGSSLFEKPLDENISIADLRQLNKLLVNCGATIREINTIRKHLSAVKGGRLAMLAPDSTQISLYISDVNSDELSTIASDPTGPDDTTLDEFYVIVEKYDLIGKLPSSIVDLISNRRITETPKGDEGVFKNIKRRLLMDNRQVLSIAANLVAESGWLTEVDTGNNEEHYRVVADRLLTRLRELAAINPLSPVCIVSGGEVLCPVTGDGTGGRNQEFALYCATRLNELFPYSGVAVLSAGTDGIDGNSSAAGAVVDNYTISTIESELARARDYLQNNDSYHYLETAGDLIVTGPTGTNVRDLRLLFWGLSNG